MKSFHLWLWLLMFIIISACNHKYKEDLIADYVNLKATLSNTKETIQLGDTITITLRLPDTLHSNNRDIIVNSLQYGFFGITALRIDTIRKRGDFLKPNIDFWASAGSISSSITVTLKKTNKPYEVVLHYKFKEKGLYLFEIVPQPGKLNLNNNTTCYTVINFDVPDKHFNILSIIAPHFSGQAYYDAFVEQDSNGFGVYFFRVE